MSDFKPGDINTDTGSVYQPNGRFMPLRAYLEGNYVVLSGKLGVASFSVFHCPDVKHTEPWKNKNAIKRRTERKRLEVLITVAPKLIREAI